MECQSFDEWFAEMRTLRPHADSFVVPDRFVGVAQETHEEDLASELESAAVVNGWFDD